MRADEKAACKHARDIWEVQNDYTGFRKLDRAAIKRSQIQLEKDGDIRASVWLKDKTGLPFHFSPKHLISDFRAIQSLKELCETYYCCRKSLWKLLEQLGLDPWGRVIKDYETPRSLEQVAKRHGLKSTTLSDGLKQRDVPIRSGRIPVQLDAAEVQDALKDDPSINELRRRLQISWAKAKEQMDR